MTMTDNGTRVQDRETKPLRATGSPPPPLKKGQDDDLADATRAIDELEGRSGGRDTRRHQDRASDRRSDDRRADDRSDRRRRADDEDDADDGQDRTRAERTTDRRDIADDGEDEPLDTEADGDERDEDREADEDVEDDSVEYRMFVREQSEARDRKPRESATTRREQDEDDEDDADENEPTPPRGQKSRASGSGIFDDDTIAEVEADVGKSAAAALKKANAAFSKVQAKSAKAMEAVQKDISSIARAAHALLKDRHTESKHQIRDAIDKLRGEGYDQVFGRRADRMTDKQDRAVSDIIDTAARFKSWKADQDQYISLADAVGVVARQKYRDIAERIEKRRARTEAEELVKSRHARADVLPGRGGGRAGVRSSGDELADAAGAIGTFMRKRGIRG